MFEHLANCHGEWNALMVMITSIPLLGICIRSKLYKSEVCNADR